MSAIHESHTHFDCFCLATIDLKTSSTIAAAPLLDEIDALAPANDDVEGADAAALLLLTPQHTHLVAEFSFGVKHDEHDHLFCVCLAARALNASSHFVGSVDGTCLANENSGFFGSIEVSAGGFVVGVVDHGDDVDDDDDDEDDDGIAVPADVLAFITIGSLNL